MNPVLFQDQELSVKFNRYLQNGRLSIQLVDAEGPYGHATVNLPDEPLGEGEVFIKDSAENEGILKALVDAGVVEDTGRRVQYGFSEAVVARLLVAPQGV